MTEKAAAVGSPSRTAASESAADQSYHLTSEATPEVRRNRFKTSLRTLRALAYLHLSDFQRADAIELLRLCEQLATPPPAIRYSTFPDLQERRRRALEPRPGDFPGFGAA